MHIHIAFKTRKIGPLSLVFQVAPKGHKDCTDAETLRPYGKARQLRAVGLFTSTQRVEQRALAAVVDEWMERQLADRAGEWA